MLFKKKKKLSFEAENLAVPEVHTGSVESNEKLEDSKDDIQYDTLAIPEIHIHHNSEDK